VTINQRDCYTYHLYCQTAKSTLEQARIVPQYSAFGGLNGRIQKKGREDFNQQVLDLSRTKKMLLGGGQKRIAAQHEKG